MNDDFIADAATVDGYRDPRERKPLPDVTLTGDEFVHMLAIQGETLREGFAAHGASRVPRGFPSPDCLCCHSIMDKAERYQRTIAERGLT